MLYRFIIENYKSFKERNEISFIPEESLRHAAYRDSSLPVLRDSVIYGANAAGKSNVVKAIHFVRKLVITNKTSMIIPKLAFRMDRETIKNPSLFVVEIRCDDGLYQYGIALSFSQGIILNEWLRKYNNQEKNWNNVFARIWNSKTQRYKVDFNFFEGTNNESRYQTYKEDLSSSMKILALTELANKQIQGDEFINSINSVYHWFEDLIIIFPNSRYNLLGRVVKNLDSVNKLYKKYFKIFGIDIDEIRLSAVPTSYLQLPEDVIEEIRMDLMKDDKNNMAMIHGKGQDYLAKLTKDKTLDFSEVRFVHKQQQHEVEFSQDEESDGTQRLFDLIPMLGYVVDSNKVVIIDEVDRSLHCLLTQEMFKYFIANTQERCSQLICTTHQVLLMNLRLLGRREIWFVEKENKSSKIYALDQYKFDGETLDVTDNYLVGRFGGIPKY